jgi:alkylation response protein AidB-like acyl-CoA dehydrogenase
MYYFLNEDQVLMVENAKEFAENEIKACVPDIENEIFPQNLLEQLDELGYLNMYLPEEYGGISETMVTHMAIVEEFAKVNFMMAVVGNQNMVGELILKHGTEEQKEKFVAEPGFIGFGFTEPTAGSDAAGIKTTAVKDGDEWVINGQKTFISYLNSCKAFLVSARTNETGKGGISAFVVYADAPGVKIGSIFDKIGFRGSDTGELFLENVRVPAINMIGPENKGLNIALELLDSARLAIAACGVGIAQGALDKALAFVKQRETFGKPVITNQGIQFMLANMQTKIDAARALVYYTAELYDKGENINAWAAKAKLFASDMAQEVTRDAVQLCGGYGLCKDFDIERHYRDAMVLSITEGTNEMLRTVIARGMMK